MASEQRQNEYEPEVDESVVKATLAAQKPPTEGHGSIITRRWILFSFWAVALFLGLPLWLWTTSVPRANLPLESMNRWAAGQVSASPVHALLDYHF